MSPENLFPYTGMIAMVGWLALALSPFAPRAAQIAAALVIPLLLSVAYTALVLAFWADAAGGFDSLANVMALFTNPGVALAGWIHYLTFDLFIGAWIVRTARVETINHLFVLPCLALTFLFGPAGFLSFAAFRAIGRLRRNAAASQ
jgi:Domain of unknown function (DUF4281)